MTVHGRRPRLRASQSYERVKMYRVLAALLVVFIGTVVSNNKARCAHGQWEVDHCVCEDDYVGQRCQRKMHCSSFMRNFDGSCISCKEWWEGSHCDAIKCNGEHGSPTKDLLMCECTPPYTGEHCEILTTQNVYYYYNRRMAQFGPIGALTLIPMVACFMVCNFFAKRRHVKRVEKALGDQRVYGDVDSDVVEDLLANKGP